MTEHRFRQQYTLALDVEANAIHRAVSRSPTVQRNIFIIMSLVLLGMKALYGNKMQPDIAGFALWIVPSIILAALLAWFPNRLNNLGLRRQVQAQWDAVGLKEREVLYEFDGESFGIEGDALGGKMKWTDIHAWADDKDLLLIYRGPQCFYYVEKAKIEPASLSALKEHLLSSPAKQW